MSTPVTTKKVPTESLEKLLNRIKEIRQYIKVSAQKFRRQKIELYVATYLYVEKAISEKKAHNPHQACALLAEKLGSSRDLWYGTYRAGVFVRNHKIDLESARPYSVFIAAKFAMDTPDASKLTSLINAGGGATVVGQFLRERGYAIMRQMPQWKKKEIRAHKKKLSDWTPELEHLLSAIAQTTDDNQTLSLTLKVRGKEVITVTEKK